LEIDIGDADKSAEYSLKDSSLGDSPIETEPRRDSAIQGAESQTTTAKTDTEKDSDSLTKATVYNFPEKQPMTIQEGPTEIEENGTMENEHAEPQQYKYSPKKLLEIQSTKRYQLCRKYLQLKT
jgi:hypothetical protein